MALPEDLAPALTDGVVLCHLANHVKPRSVASIHVPSPAVVSVFHRLEATMLGYLTRCNCRNLQPKLTMARCRRNVDNFLEACRKIGVDEVSLIIRYFLSNSFSNSFSRLCFSLWSRGMLQRTTSHRVLLRGTKSFFRFSLFVVQRIFPVTIVLEARPLRTRSCLFVVETRPNASQGKLETISSARSKEA